jgi:hypothetical protein
LAEHVEARAGPPQREGEKQADHELRTEQRPSGVSGQHPDRPGPDLYTPGQHTRAAALLGRPLACMAKAWVPKCAAANTTASGRTRVARAPNGQRAKGQQQCREGQGLHGGTTLTGSSEGQMRQCSTTTGCAGEHRPGPPLPQNHYRCTSGCAAAVDRPGAGLI